MSSNMEIPVNYRDFQGPVSTLTGLNPRTWLYPDAGEEFNSPRGTHHMLYDYDEFPPFMRVKDQSNERVNRFFTEGYRPTAGILLLGSMTVRQAVRLHERGQEKIANGALVGPYFMDNQLMHGIKIYERRTLDE